MLTLETMPSARGMEKIYEESEGKADAKPAYEVMRTNPDVKAALVPWLRSCSIQLLVEKKTGKKNVGNLFPTTILDDCGRNHLIFVDRWQFCTIIRCTMILLIFVDGHESFEAMIFGYKSCEKSWHFQKF